ncbi:MAG: hypothetical protein ACTSQB_04545 [Candidatus Heimdallarchaeota archaeon]
MNKKQKMILGVMILLVMSPLVGMVMLDQVPLEAGMLEISPDKSYAMSADCVVTAADSGVTNADDTDNLYGGGYRSYVVTANCSFGTRGSDIDNITISFYKATTEYFSFVYDNDTETATESVGTSFVRIGTVSNVTSGVFANITVAFKVEWAMTDVDDVDLNITAWNGDNATSAQVNGNYDFDTDLTLASTDFVQTTSIGAGGSIIFNSAIVSYEDSGGNNYPAANETDFLITRTPSTGSTDSWTESSYAGATGIAIFATITAGHIAQLETFTFTTYTQDGTTTNLFGAAKTDKVDVMNSGGGGSEGVPGQSAFGDFFADPQSMLLVGIVIVGGYLAYDLFLKEKPRSRGSSKKRTKPKK